MYKFFFYWTVLVLIVEDMDSICRLWVVTVNVAGMLFVTLLWAPARLADIRLVACHTC